MKNQSLPSHMGHTFSQVPAPSVQRSVFDRKHTHKTTFDEGYLIPHYVDEILPNDTVSLKATFFARLATLVAPFMDNLFLDVFYFWVPNRLLWSNWTKFMGEQQSPDDSIDYEVPFLTGPSSIVNFQQYTLGDYFGLPILDDLDANVENQKINSLPFRAYNMIWDYWFRDENLQDGVGAAPGAAGDGPDAAAMGFNLDLLKRGKKHDYFTSCLPWPQKGDAVAIPLGTTAPVVGTGLTIGLSGGYGLTSTGETLGRVLAPFTNTFGDPAGTANSGAGRATNDVGWGLSDDPTKSGMVADLASATSATIAQLREAFATQQLLEQFARGGTRYVELLKSTFGAYLPDYTAQRPEFLAGYSQRINVAQVPQTSESGTTKQGNLAAYGQVSSECGFHRSFQEHGYIIGLLSVRADITYQQNIRKMWSRRTRFDFYWPALAHLGEQAVLNQEIYYGSEINPEFVWGYQERWAEYRYFPSMVTGAFRSGIELPLDYWHLALDFHGVMPVLNDTFIQDAPPVSRVVAVTDQPHFLCDIFTEQKHVRPMPVYSVPGLQRL